MANRRVIICYPKAFMPAGETILWWVEESEEATASWLTLVKGYGDVWPGFWGLPLSIMGYDGKLDTENP